MPTLARLHPLTEKETRLPGPGDQRRAQCERCTWKGTLYERMDGDDWIEIKPAKDGTAVDQLAIELKRLQYDELDPESPPIFDVGTKEEAVEIVTAAHKAKLAEEARRTHSVPKPRQIKIAPRTDDDAPVNMSKPPAKPEKPATVSIRPNVEASPAAEPDEDSDPAGDDV